MVRDQSKRQDEELAFLLAEMVEPRAQCPALTKTATSPKKRVSDARRRRCVGLMGQGHQGQPCPVDLHWETAPSGRWIRGSRYPGREPKGVAQGGHERCPGHPARPACTCHLSSLRMRPVHAEPFLLGRPKRAIRASGAYLPKPLDTGWPRLLLIERRPVGAACRYPSCTEYRGSAWVRCFGAYCSP